LAGAPASRRQKIWKNALSAYSSPRPPGRRRSGHIAPHPAVESHAGADITINPMKEICESKEISVAVLPAFRPFVQLGANFDPASNHLQTRPVE
jgi:hypothetical protein